jgi:hypothetical protein
MRKILAVATVGLCLVSAGRVLADAELTFANPAPNVKGPPVLTIRGSITRRDADYVAKHEAELGKGPLIVSLNSHGGSVAAALAIGRIIRKNEATVMVPESGECFSSCAFLFIAGVNRMNYGVIGLHRPFYEDAPPSRQVIEEQMPAMLQEIKNYVQSMGISDAFFDEIMRTDPIHVRLYRGEAIFALVPQSEAITSEIEIARDARLRGITMGEMRRREREAEEKCSSRGFSGQRDAATPHILVCLDSILWGLSESVYQQRRAKADWDCKYSDSDKAAIDTAGRNWRDLPVALKNEECVRNIMLVR